MRNRIACDLDGVVADIVSQIINYADRWYGLVILPEQIVSDQVQECTPLSFNQLKEMFTNREFFATMAPIEGARAALRELLSLGFLIDIVTDRFWYPEIQMDTRSWLESNRIPFDEVEFVRSREKHLMVAKKGYRFAVEDQAANATLLQPVTQVFLLDRPYNRRVNNAHVRRVGDLADVSSAITNLVFDVRQREAKAS